MSRTTLSVDETVQRYLLDVTVNEPAVLRDLRSETARLDGAAMQVSPEQGRFMSWLVQLVGARRTLEVGVFTGYSSLVVALALPDDGRIVACDVNAEWTGIAQRYWVRAGVDHKVDLRLGPALGTLDALVDQGHAASFDFAFIDADKALYDAYYERCLRLVRLGGVVAVDNALWGGAVARPDDGRESTRAIAALNAKVCRDPRVQASLIPVGDGLLLARRVC